MEYTSFYGGRRGASFVIVKSYPSIAEMVAAFSQGGAYKTVGYDEYVIIDAVDKNDIDNGKVYRRGYDYSNDVGGAIYIGQIVGPDGAAPQVEMKTYQEVEDIYKNHGPIDLATGDEYRKTEGEYAPTENLIPGQYYDEGGTEKFNDSIKWVACSIRDEHSNSSTVHVGFIIPYMVTQWTANSVSPYYHRSDAANQEMENWDETGDTDTFYNDKLATRVDDLSHPYFEKWDFKVPKGIKGDAFKNLRVTTVAECNEQHPGWLQQYAGMSDDEVTEAIKKERKIFVYDYYHYDKDGGGEPVSIYLGDYNSITNVDLAENGTLTIDYSHNDEEVWDRIFKWITSVKLDTETGHFSIEFNHEQDANGEPTIYETDLRWVKDIEFQDNGSVNLKYTTNTDLGLEYDRLIKWIKDVTLDPDTGKLTVKYNYDETPNGKPTIYEQDLRWVKEVTVDEEGTITFDYTNGDDTIYENMFKWIKSVTLDSTNGHLEVLYNYDEKDGQPTKYETDLRWVNNIEVAENGTITLKYTTGADVVLNNKIKWITQTTLALDGTLTVTYNDNNTDVFDKQIKWIDAITFEDNGHLTITYNNGTPRLEKDILWISNVEINTGETEGTGNQKIKITFNNGTSKEIGMPLNYIMQVAINDKYHLLVLYSDPAKRQEITTYGKNVSWNDRDDWYDLGYIGNGQVGTIASRADDAAAATIANTLPPYSAWFIIED